jgi:hypothetical protein
MFLLIKIEGYLSHDQRLGEVGLLCTVVLAPVHVTHAHSLLSAITFMPLIPSCRREYEPHLDRDMTYTLPSSFSTAVQGPNVVW